MRRTCGAVAAGESSSGVVVEVLNEIKAGRSWGKVEEHRTKLVKDRGLML